MQLRPENFPLHRQGSSSTTIGTPSYLILFGRLIVVCHKIEVWLCVLLKHMYHVNFHFNFIFYF